MTVFVDSLMDYGWKLRGHSVKNCHMFTDDVDLTELHEMALKIGMKRQWFQDKKTAPHYDLTESRRMLAVNFGAIELDRKDSVEIWKLRREKLSKFKP